MHKHNEREEEMERDAHEMLRVKSRSVAIGYGFRHNDEGEKKRLWGSRTQNHGNTSIIPQLSVEQTRMFESSSLEKTD